MPGKTPYPVGETMAPQRSPNPARCRRPGRWPRSARRGLGLLDALLASLVLSALMLWGGQIIGTWAQARILANDARAVAELARAGRLLVEGDVTHPARRHGVGAAPVSIALAALEGEGLRNPAAGSRTPGRRDLSLWSYRPHEGVLVMIARARGLQPIARAPSAEDGVTSVGALLPGFGDRLVGPGVNWDMAALNLLQPGFARESDLFALSHVALDVTCHSYLYRVDVDCNGDGTEDPEANTMAVDLQMEDNGITGVGLLQADEASIGTLRGAVTLDQDLNVEGDLKVDGTTSLNTATVNGPLTAHQTMEIGGTLTVQDVTASGTVTGANLAFDGTLTVSGTARLGDAVVERLTVNTLTVDQLSAEDGRFNARVVATDVTATTCTGCAP